MPLQILSLYKSIDCTSDGELKTAPFDLHTRDELPRAGRRNKTFWSASMPSQRNANTYRCKHTHAHPNKHKHTGTNICTHTHRQWHTHIRYLVCSTPTYPCPTFTLYIEDFFWAEFIVNQWMHWKLWEKNTLCGRPLCGDIMVVTSSSSSHQHHQHPRPLCGDILLLTSSTSSSSKPSTS